ncbi:MAG: hypothetical protein ABIN24_03760 [Dyadobacter sp.]
MWRCSTAKVLSEAILDSKKTILDSKKAILDSNVAILDNFVAILDSKSTRILTMGSNLVAGKEK